MLEAKAQLAQPAKVVQQDRLELLARLEQREQPGRLELLEQQVPKEQWETLG